MREIKFRAWDGVKMIDCREWQVMSLNIPHACGFEEVMQFTGLRDKNEKEIYEGDVVRHSWSFEVNEEACESEDEICEVKYEGSSFVLLKTNSHWNGAPLDAAEELEVIGNIYENPELLPPPA